MQLLITAALVFCLLRPSSEFLRFAANLKDSIQGAFGKEDQENKAESCLRSEFQNGIEKFGIPSLEPLEIWKAEITLGGNNLLCLGDATGSVEVQDLNCNGLTQWKITARSSKVTGIFPLLFTKSITAIFKTIKCETKYSDLNLTFKNKKFLGSGEIKFTTKNLVLNVTFDYKVFGEEVTRVNISPSLESMEAFKITGLNFDSDLSEEISKKVLRDASTLFDENDSNLNACLQEAISNNSSKKESLITYLINKCT